MSKAKIKIKGLKLYQSISILVFIVILLSVLVNSYFLTRQMGSMVSVRLGSNAQKISMTIVGNQEIKEALSKKPIDEAAINRAIGAISSATNSSIVIFDSRENIVGIFNSTNDSMLKSNPLSKISELPGNMFKSNKAETIFDDNHKPLGYVIVAFPENLSKDLSSDAVDLIQVTGIIGLAVGILGAVLLSKQIKHSLSGYEPKELAAILLERNILLDTVEEGIITVDADMDIYMLNKRAKELLSKAGLPENTDWEKKPFKTIADDTILVQVSKNNKPLDEQTININGLEVLASISPLQTAGGVNGLLITLNEKNTVQEMAKRLSGVTNYADTLRAQTHEFMNKMHVIKGLIYTNNLAELKKYISDITEDSSDDLKDINSKIHDPVLAAFLFGKKSRAQEKLVEFSLTEECNFPEEMTEKVDVHELIVIIGNLLENSFDVLQKKKDDRLVNLSIMPYEDELLIQVENNGEAISKENISKIFIKGYTTKGAGHGFGLALVKQHLDSLHGTIQIESDELNGTEFTIEIPLKEDLKND